jgi:hypothetical protein
MQKNMFQIYCDTCRDTKVYCWGCERASDQCECKSQDEWESCEDC